MCGVGINEGFTARYFMNPSEVAFAAAMTYQRAQGVNSSSPTYNLRDAKSICLMDCPAVRDSNTSAAFICNYPDSIYGHPRGALPDGNYTTEQWVADGYDYFADLDEEAQLSSLQWKGPCYPLLFGTVNTFQTCQYSGETADASQTYLIEEYGEEYYDIVEGTPLSEIVEQIGTAVDELLSGPLSVLERYVDDFTTGWKVLLVAGCVCPIVLSVIFLVCLRYLTSVFASLILFLVNALAIVLTIYLFLKAGVIGSDAVTAYVSKAGESYAEDLSTYIDPADSNQAILKIFAWLSLTATVIFFLFTIVMFTRVKVAVGVIRVSTVALAKMPTLLAFPLVPAVSMILLMVYWMFTMVFLYSSGSVKMQDCAIDPEFPPGVFCANLTDTETCHCGFTTDYNRELQGALVYYVFGFLWGSQWIVAVSYLVLACVFVQYYFAGGDYNAAKNSPILAATKRMIWYHSGTAAVGSFFVALLQFIRIIVRMVIYQMKRVGKKSKVFKAVGYAIECCLWYLQKLIEWLSRNAYIMTAIEGTSFCSSAWNALALIVKNVASVSSTSVISDIMLFLGKLAVSLGSGVIAFMMLDDDNFKYGDEKVTSPLFIVILVILFAFLIASLFMSIIEFGIDTIMLCYCKDCDDNGGVPLNAPKQLVTALNMTNTVAKARAQDDAARAARK
jgi:choline transporter-like protein 2/4/5